MFIESTRYDRVINRLAFALLCLVPLAMFPDGTRFNVAISKFVSLAIISLVFFALVIREKRFHLRLDRTENRWLLAYVILLIVSTIVALDPTLAILGSEARRDGLITFVFYLVAYSIGRRVRVTEKFLVAITLSTSLIAIYAALQFFKIDPEFLRLYPDNWRGLAFSTLGNPNFLGSYFVLTLPIPIYLYLIRGRWIGLPLYALAYFGLLATRTRGTWIGAMVGFIVLVLLAYRQSTNTRRTLRRIIILSLISILLFALFILLTDEVMLNKLLRMFTDLQLIITHPEEADTAGSNRFYIWQRTVDLIRQRPILGVGVENMSLAMYRNFREMITQDFGRYRNWDKAHNEYLNIALASGIPSLIAYLGFTFTAIGIGWKKRRDCPLLLPFLAGAIGYMVQAFFNIQIIIVYYFFLATLGILVSEVFCQTELPLEEIQQPRTEVSHDRNLYSDDHGHGV